MCFPLFDVVYGFAMEPHFVRACVRVCVCPCVSMCFVMCAHDVYFKYCVFSTPFPRSHAASPSAQLGLIRVVTRWPSG